MTFLDNVEGEFQKYLGIAGTIGMLVFVIQMMGPMLSGDTGTLAHITAEKIGSSVLVGAFSSLILAIIGMFRGIF